VSQALEAFKLAHDASNTALMLSNLARVARQQAALPLPLGVEAAAAEVAVQRSTPLQLYREAQQLCRVAADALGRREAQSWVWNVVQMELATCQLAEGLYRRQSAAMACVEDQVLAAMGVQAQPPGEEGMSPAARNTATAVELLTRALHTFQAVGNGAASQLAVAHFHLGHALSDAAEAEGDDAEAVAGRRHRSLKITLPVRALLSRLGV
jgi:hypothetical protein